MKIHFLDVGLEMYGDCILIEHGGRFILIDGAHRADGSDRGTGRPSIPDQLEQFMGPPPFQPDLLIVTHVHGDHVGCLPGLVATGLLAPQRVLAADPVLGSGGMATSDAPQDRIVEALLEEMPIQTIEDAEQLLDWSPEQAYQTMLQSFDSDTVWIYGEHPVEDLEADFADFRLKVLGPTRRHLEICSNLIASEKAAATRRVNDLTWPVSADAIGKTDAEILLRLVDSRPIGADMISDRAGQGSAKNNQSIVISVDNGKHRALLAGDMQFQVAEVPGLDALMGDLLDKVAEAGPYTVVKLTHHTSYNGMAEEVLDRLGGNPLLIHTGGLNDPGHPNSKVLSHIKKRMPRAGFLRTDRNGCVSLDLDRTKIKVSHTLGSADDYSPNSAPARRRTTGVRRRDELSEASSGPASTLAQKDSDKADFVEVVTRVPHARTKVTVTIEVTPHERLETRVVPQLVSAGRGASSEMEVRPDMFEIAGGRNLPNLLVVTSTEQLERQIGAEACKRIVGSIKGSGLTLLDLVAGIPDPEPSIQQVHAKLRSSKFDGVIILGGYSVIPSVRISAIDDDVRALATSEMDNYIVWSDDPYVTLDDDGIPDLSISRIPSLPGQPGLVERCLQATGPTGSAKAFGLRNQARPFADGVFQLISAGTCHPSIPAVPGAYPPPEMDSDHFYFMLHGHYAQGEAFTGEDGNGGYPVAISTAEIPQGITGVVFAGCCYGALLTDGPAMFAKPTKFPRERDLDESMALSLLAAGAQAFVGCTGIHYSPPIPNTMGEPLHRYFWENVKAGQAPATALFNAKLAYLNGVPHTGTDDATDFALEMKIFTQFTCLGLGW